MQLNVRIPATALVFAVVLALAAAMVAPAGGPSTAGRSEAAGAKTERYVVLYAKGASLAAARTAVKEAGGRIVRENTRVGLATVDSANGDFIAAVRTEARPARRGP